MANLDLAKGPVPRSEMVDAAVRFGLELFEDTKNMAERCPQAAKAREKGDPWRAHFYRNPRRIREISRNYWGK